MITLATLAQTPAQEHPWSSPPSDGPRSEPARWDPVWAGEYLQQQGGAVAAPEPVVHPYWALRTEPSATRSEGGEAQDTVQDLVGFSREEEVEAEEATAAAAEGVLDRTATEAAVPSRAAVADSL